MATSGSIPSLGDKDNKNKDRDDAYANRASVLRTSASSTTKKRKEDLLSTRLLRATRSPFLLRKLVLPALTLTLSLPRKEVLQQMF